MSQIELGRPWQERLWHLMDEVRGKVPMDMPNLIRIAEQHGILVDPAFIEWAALYLDRLDPYVQAFSPPFVAEFIGRYLRQTDKKTDKVLDPCIGLGTMLSTLQTIIAAKTAVGIEIDPAVVETAKTLPGASKIDWYIGDGLAVLDDMDADFDVVIGDPPFDLSIHQIALQDTQDQESHIEDTLGALLLLKSARLLGPDGVGFYLVPPRFLTGRLETSVIRQLARFGLYLDTALSLPSGTFAKSRKSEAYLVIIKRAQANRMFVGELSRDHSASQHLLENLVSRKSAEEPRLGTLVQRDQFTSFQILMAKRELGQFARATKQTITRFGAIAAFNVLKVQEWQAVEDKPNCFYLPSTTCNMPAVVSASDMRLKPHHYIQIVLDPEKANSTYLANFFNTPLGAKIREANCTRGATLRLTKAGLEQAELPLPHPDVQTAIVGLNSQLTDLTTRLDEERRRLWNAPQKHKEIAGVVKTFQSVDGLAAWMDSLPFPLASILWAYQAAGNDRQKVEHLLHFFEATAQFFVILLVSSLYKEPTCASRGLVGASFHTSFGLWDGLLAQNMKRMRTLRKAKETESMCRELFGFPDDGFLDMLMDEEIFHILERVRPQRNRWKGHGGVYNPSDLQNRRLFLEGELANLRSRISDHFSTQVLISPLSMRLRGGIYHNNVQILMGARTPFQVESRQTLVPLEDERLYILHANQTTPVEVLPFVRIGGLYEKEEPTPEERNACYFFGRMDNQNVVFVSYHFTAQGELPVKDELIKTFLPLIVLEKSEEAELQADIRT